MEQRRTSDIKINELIDKVEKLDDEVSKLRHEFDMHIQIEDRKYDELKVAILTIQSQTAQLLIEIKEPLETYKTAKYGVNFIKFIVETAKWLVPLSIALFVGYTATSTDNQIPIHIERKEK